MQFVNQVQIITTLQLLFVMGWNSDSAKVSTSIMHVCLSFSSVLATDNLLAIFFCYMKTVVITNKLHNYTRYQCKIYHKYCLLALYWNKHTKPSMCLYISWHAHRYNNIYHRKRKKNKTFTERHHKHLKVILNLYLSALFLHVNNS